MKSYIKKSTRLQKGHQRIICVNTGLLTTQWPNGSIETHDGTACPLQLHETYTTPGPVVGKAGLLYYPINEFGGIEMLSRRFVVYNTSGNRKSISNP